MKKGLFNKLLPHIIAVVIFLIVTVIFCSPALQGKVVNQHDILGWKGIAQQSIEFREKHGHYPLWSNSVFSGMPAYTFAMEASHPILTGFVQAIITLNLPKPLHFFFLACVCFYFLCIVLRINPWISITAALAYAFSTFDPIIVAVGHDSQMMAIGLAPGVIGSFLLILQRKYLWGAALLAILFGFQVGTQHIQIIYYTGIVIAFIILFYLIYSWKRNEIKAVVPSLATALGAFAIGFFTFAVTMLPLREYAKETMRGGQSALTQTSNSTNKTKGGLDKDYAFNWSYGIGETFTIIVPGIYGGSNGGHEHKSSTTFTEKLTEVGVPEDQALQMANAYSYWGTQPSTSGPVYLGAVVCFLFIFGMVYLKSWHKGWIIAATVFAVLLAWGKNFSVFNYFLFDYLPLYNKFRAPTMSLVIPQLTFPLTGALALNQLLTDTEKRENLWNKFKLAVYVTAGIAGILVLLYFALSFKSPNDAQIGEGFANSMLSQASRSGQPTAQVQQQAQAFGQSLVHALQEDRRSLYGGDLIRSILFIGLTVVLIGAYLKNKLKPLPLLLGVLLLSSIDVLGVGKRYLNDDVFVDASDYEATFTPTEADQQILADPQKPFRVFDNTDQTNGPFQSSRASYFHNSVGGYSPAKLSIYQDLIEHQLSKSNMAVFNMLNTRYFITPNPANGKAVAQLNPNAFGPVWLVKAIKMVPTADAEMNALDNTSLKDTAVVQQQFAPAIKLKPNFDSTASIKLLENLNDKITYSFNANSDQFAVFSEVYYPLGWNAYIDGKRADYVKTDYVLRGMAIPAGKHTIEFRFEPQSFKIGDTLTLICGILALLLLAAAILMEVKKT